MSMKLVIAIVQNEDNQKLNNALVKEGFRSTRLATSGGFLRTGNTTVMIGVEESKLEEVLGIIESVCKARKQTVSAVAPSVDTTGFYIPYPVEVSVGGATVFILDVEQFRRMTRLREREPCRLLFLWAGVLRKAGAQPDGKRQKLMRGAAENMVKWVRL